MSETLVPDDLGASPTADAPGPELVCLPGGGDVTPSDVDHELLEEAKEGDETGRGGGVGTRRSYGREEMEAMRLATDAVQQQRLWEEVYQGMDEATAREYDKLRATNSGKKKNEKSKKKKKPRTKGNELPPLVGQEFDSTNTKNSNDFNPSDIACDCSGFAHEVEAERREYDGISNDDDSSDDEYGSIQKPAFFVEGEPDFDSGPPLDGMEYLRRVRWETSQIPKVKVAKLKSSGQVNVQTSYMPKIPEIATCPSHLLPSKHWEDAFLADFKELRKAFLSMEDSCEQPLTLRHGKPSVCTQMPISAPIMTAVRGMDAVTRAAKLRDHISLFESSNTLSTHDYQWLFALSVAVDTPPDADTSASLRCLLRECSNILAKKSRHDGEVAMLNILITITGKYFGQSELRSMNE